MKVYEIGKKTDNYLIFLLVTGQCINTSEKNLPDDQVYVYKCTINKYVSRVKQGTLKVRRKKENVVLC